MMPVQEQLLTPPLQCSCQRTSFWQQKNPPQQQGRTVGKDLAFSSFPSYPISEADDDEMWQRQDIDDAVEEDDVIKI